MFGNWKFWSKKAVGRHRAESDCDALALKLEPKAASVLAVLREARGATVAREALLDRCWAPGQGSDEALTQAVAQLRRVLNDDRASPRFVSTVPRVGYRWIGHEAPLTAARRGSVPLMRSAGLLLAGFALAVVGGVAAFAVSGRIWPAEKTQITTEVRLGKDGQKQVVAKTVQR